jgi:hypothetical protein
LSFERWGLGLHSLPRYLGNNVMVRSSLASRLRGGYLMNLFWCVTVARGAMGCSAPFGPAHWPLLFAGYCVGGCPPCHQSAAHPPLPSPFRPPPLPSPSRAHPDAPTHPVSRTHLPPLPTHLTPSLPYTRTPHPLRPPYHLLPPYHLRPPLEPFAPSVDWASQVQHRRPGCDPDPNSGAGPAPVSRPPAVAGPPVLGPGTPRGHVAALRCPQTAGKAAL